MVGWLAVEESFLSEQAVKPNSAQPTVRLNKERNFMELPQEGKFVNSNYLHSCLQTKVTGASPQTPIPGCTKMHPAAQRLIADKWLRMAAVLLRRP